MSRSRRKDTRRRTGCLQCKEKHIQCTEEHPRCRRCETLGLHCIWSKQSRKTQCQRKVPFQAVSLHSYIDRWIFLNVTAHDFEAEDTCIRPSSCPELDLIPALSPSPYHPLHSFPETEAYLLDYFIQGISPSCSLSASHNPYVSLVIPLCFTSETLRNALLAVAANQLCLLGRGHLRQEACLYKDKALQGVRRDLSVGLQDEGTIATVLMLCFQDISDGCSPSWMTHLRGGLQLMDSNASRRTPSLWSFFRMYFVAHDIMSHTAFDNGDADSYDDGQVSPWSENDDLDEIDVLMGCSRGLMALIRRISVLASTRAKVTTVHNAEQSPSSNAMVQILSRRAFSPSEIKNQAIATLGLHRAVVSLTQRLPSHSLDRKDLQAIAEIKRLAALLYLTERLGTRHEAAEILRGQTHMKRPSLETSAQSKYNLITSIITSISALPDTNTATLLWPLFVLGNVASENEEHRRFVLNRLFGIQKARNLGSVRRTIEAVKHAFGTRGVLDLPGDKGVEVRGSHWGHERYRFISLA
ncbi:Zn(II)2Cys6 transcription factor [Aspergillus mulundensis]|uniref:Zn(2)-C6 fungal-type domain-containing protein n=1 Tax=Aspergillus mulundensis TaxID=1810919 RepID=A0A3D8QJ40_9EURO|nr:hypothetical protein DSM5745_10497 [Aspergillus mulundensis]RDW61825.1 hypothetical protein DSM5745_10497 [Aspergillus mulundensis]